jgi:hypothetical protein
MLKLRYSIAVKEKEQRQLDKQAARLVPEVLTLEALMGLSVEGAGSAWCFLSCCGHLLTIHGLYDS